MKNRHISGIRRVQLEDKTMELEGNLCIRSWSVGEMSRRSSRKDGAVELNPGLSDPVHNAVSELSDDPSVRANGGVTNWIIEGRESRRYPQELVDSLFDPSAQRGEISGPFESPQGTWYAQLEERRAAQIATFEESRRRIDTAMQRRHHRDRYAEFVASLRAKTPIEVFPERLTRALESRKKNAGSPPRGPVTVAR